MKKKTKKIKKQGKAKNWKKNEKRRKLFFNKVEQIISECKFKNHGHLLNFEVRAIFDNFDHQEAIS